MKGLRVIIAGSRDFDDYLLLSNIIDNVLDVIKSKTENNNIEIISGTARGADSLGERYAFEHGYKVKRFIPDWDGLGKRAGYVRNADMAKFACENGNQGMLIAFWDGKSKGTKHMIDLAKRYGLEVHIVNF